MDSSIIIGLRKLQKIKPKRDQKWCVISYILSDEVKDGMHGLWNLIGTYNNREDAIDTAKDLVKETGITSIYAMPTCEWREIDERVKVDRTIIVEDEKDNIDKEIIKRQKTEHEILQKKYEDNELLKKELMKTLKLEKNEESVEYYTRLWYLAIKQYEKINHLKEEIKTIEKSYKKMIDDIKNLDIKYPDHQNNWISKLEESLPKRGEQDLLDFLITKHTEIKKLITYKENKEENKK